MKKVLYVVIRSISFEDGVGGMERSAADHIKEMSSKGYEIKLITTKEIAPDLSISEGISIAWPKNNILSLFGIEYLLWCRKVAIYFNKMDRDNDNRLIHFHGASVGVLFFLIRRENDIFITNPHGMEEFTFINLKNEINRVFIKWLAKNAIKADKVIATDNILISKVKENLKVGEDKIELIPNAVNVKKLNFLATEINYKYIKNEDEFLIVSLGRVEYNKGYDLLANSLIGLKIKNKKIKWIHFGKGSQSVNIKKIIENKGVDFKLIDGAPDTKVNYFLSKCDVFVQPSRFEGSSLTTLEAMSHGCLIVATPVGGIPDKIKHRITGLLCSDISISSIHEQLKYASDLDSHNVLKIKNKAYEYVLNNFDLDSISNKYANLYEKYRIGK